MEGKKEIYSQLGTETILIASFVKMKMVYIITGNRNVLIAVTACELAYTIAMQFRETASIDCRKILKLDQLKHLQYPKPNFAKGGIVKWELYE